MPGAVRHDGCCPVGGTGVASGSTVYADPRSPPTGSLGESGRAQPRSTAAIRCLNENFTGLKNGSEGPMNRTDVRWTALGLRPEEHTSELKSLIRSSYAVFCLKKQRARHSTP